HGHTWTHDPGPPPPACPVCGDTLVMAADPTAPANPLSPPPFVLSIPPGHPVPGGKDPTLPPDPNPPPPLPATTPAPTPAPGRADVVLLVRGRGAPPPPSRSSASPPARWPPPATRGSISPRRWSLATRSCTRSGAAGWAWCTRPGR